MSRSDEDEAAVARVLDGDTGAFAGIVERWQGPLVNLAWRFCRDRGRAEDMAQEAFIRAYRSLGSWRGESKFSTWLFALATNVYRSAMRRAVLETVELEDDQATSASVESVFGEADERRLVQAAVMSLPPRYREPLILFYFHDQDIAATAASLGLPPGTVKARLSRGRAFLKDKLGDRL